MLIVDLSIKVFKCMELILTECQSQKVFLNKFTILSKINVYSPAEVSSNHRF